MKKREPTSTPVPADPRAGPVSSQSKKGDVEGWASAGDRGDGQRGGWPRGPGFPSPGSTWSCLPSRCPRPSRRLSSVATRARDGGLPRRCARSRWPPGPPGHSWGAAREVRLRETPPSLLSSPPAAPVGRACSPSTADALKQARGFSDGETGRVQLGLPVRAPW